MGKKFKVTVDGETFEVEISEIGPQRVVTQINKEDSKIEKPKVAETQAKKPYEKEITDTPANTIKTEPISIKTKDVSKSGASIVAAPLPGKVLSVNVKKGDAVKQGGLLLVIEAMKMENEIFAPENGKIKEIFMNSGDYVITGQKLIELER
ncbi:MAG: biotin/lipoyl-containing protein [Caldisericota bacterium]|nr:biotin/lipoyl-containing protein [Caldisericota bacterium]